MEVVAKILKDFESVLLSQIGSVKLLNRVDTKFLLNVSALPRLLECLTKDYFVLEVNEQRMCHYQTVYYDTADFFYYNIHQTGRLPRTKVRIRTYLDNNQSFLEVKRKNNHGKTYKDRIAVTEGEKNIDKKYGKFLKSKLDMAADISPVLEVRYHRTTLVNKDFTERLTIDTGLNYKSGNGSADFSNLCIIELKQDKSSKSYIRDVLREHRIFKSSLSKYCLGIASLYPEVRKNNIKQKIRLINKLCNENI